VALLLAVLSAGRAEADSSFRSGNELFRECTADTEQPAQQATCFGYVAAISDVLDGGNPINGYRVCQPKTGVNLGQMKDIVVQWLQRNPQDRHRAAAGLVAKALSEAFPCR